MTELQSAWIELYMMCGFGTVIALVGIIVHFVRLGNNRRCTKQTEGTVIRHAFRGEGRMFPVIDYSVGGTTYKTKKKFNGIKTKSVSGLLIKTEVQAYEDKKGWLHVSMGSVANLRQAAEQLWPIGSKMTVYYNPANPKKCYVERPIGGGFLTFMFVLEGVFFVAMGVLFFFLMQM